MCLVIAASSKVVFSDERGWFVGEEHCWEGSMAFSSGEGGSLIPIIVVVGVGVVGELGFFGREMDCLRDGFPECCWLGSAEGKWEGG